MLILLISPANFISCSGSSLLDSMKCSSCIKSCFIRRILPGRKRLVTLSVRKLSTVERDFSYNAFWRETFTSSIPRLLFADASNVILML